MKDCLESVSSPSRPHHLESRKDPVPLGRMWFLHSHSCLKHITLRVDCTGDEDWEYSGRIRNSKGLEGLYAKGVTSHPTYIEGELVAFNLCRFPRNATEDDFGSISNTVCSPRFEYPREGAPRALKRRGRRVSKSRGTSHNLANLPYEWKNTDTNKVQNWASHGLSPTSPKPSSPTRRSDSRILRGYCGAGEFMVLAHLIIGPKTQAEEDNFRGRIVRVQGRPKNMAEDDLMLGTSQNA